MRSRPTISDDDCTWGPLRKLRVLDLRYTSVKDLAPLADLPELTTLNLSHTNVVDVGPLSNLPALSELSIWRTGVLRLEPLVPIKTLTKLLVVSSMPRAQLAKLRKLRSDIEITVERGETPGLS